MIPFASTLLLLLCPLFSFAQFTGARLTALAGSGSALADIWSVAVNPAGLAWLDQAAASLNYENLYFTPGLGVKSAAVAIPFADRNALALSAQVFGSDSYRELNGAFAFARKFGEHFSAALAVRYHQLSIPAYGSTRRFSVDAGLQYRAGDRLSFGACIKNPGKNSFAAREVNLPLPRQFSAGAAYSFSPQVQLSADIQKVDTQPATLRTGLSYAPAGQFFLRGGINAKPFSQYAVFGFTWKNLALDAACSSHPTLGYSPAFGLGYAL